MNLDRNPFVASACEDIAEGRLQTLPVHQLAPANTVADLDPTEEHTVTSTFLSLWQNLSTSGAVTPDTFLAVMRGIRIEPRHPAYRVAATGLGNVYQSQVGDDATLVFKATDDQLIWMAVIHGH